MQSCQQAVSLTTIVHPASCLLQPELRPVDLLRGTAVVGRPEQFKVTLPGLLGTAIVQGGMTGATPVRYGLLPLL